MHAAEPDLISPTTLVERTNLERWLVPVIDLHVLGRRGVLEPGWLALGCGVRHAHDPAVRTAVLEDPVDGVGRVRVGTGSEDLHELVPVLQPGGFVERSLLGHTDEARDARVCDRERWWRYRVEALVD